MNRLAEARAPPKYQSTSVGGPGAIPAEPVAVDQAAGAAGLEVLDDPLELEPLRQLATVVAAGQPDVAPDQPGPRGEIDAAALKVAAAAERDRRAGQDDQAGVVLDLDGPLLGGIAVLGRVNAGGRLAGHDGPRSGPRGDLDQVAVAVQQAGGEVDQVEQRRRFRVNDERRHHADRHLLVAGSQPGLVAAADQLDACAADPASLVSGESEGPGIRAASGARRA